MPSTLLDSGCASRARPILSVPVTVPTLLRAFRPGWRLVDGLKPGRRKPRLFRDSGRLQTIIMSKVSASHEHWTYETKLSQVVAVPNTRPKPPKGRMWRNAGESRQAWTTPRALVHVKAVFQPIQPCFQTHKTLVVPCGRFHLTDARDNRGKRHALAFVVAGVVLAILSGRSKVSSIFRYLRNRIEWLREVTHSPDAGVVSRAHLPRLLARVDWVELNTLIDRHFGVQMELRAHHDWVAIDGKVLRGTLASGDKQSVVFAVSHASRTLLAHAPMQGSKASEIPVVRDLLTHSQLEAHKVTLDAHHCNPQTTAQIHQAGGQYVIQVKENQPLLLTQCQHVAATAVPLGSYDACEKGHGRLTTREGQCFDMRALSLAPRWSDSGVHTLVVMKRHTLTLTTQKTTCETAYYLSNQALNTDPQAQAMALTGAIRQHWHVESDNWIRDVMFDEDNVKTTSANQAQGMGCLRSLAASITASATWSC